MEDVAPFDASDYLDNEETMAEYLSVAAQDPDPDMLLMAIADVAKAKGMNKLAEDSGLGRENLYKFLEPGARPCQETLSRILGALNFKLDKNQERPLANAANCE